MRQPANLRGATLPGLSQPSEKEGPHHRSFWLLRLQRSLSFRLVVEGGYLRLWKTTKHCSPFGQKGSPSCMRAGSVTCSQWGFAFLHVFLCVWLPSWFWWFSKVTHSVWKMVATESEAWHANGQGSMIACSGVGRLNHSKLWVDGAHVNLAEGRWLGAKFHRFTITSSPPVLSTGMT